MTTYLAIVSLVALLAATAHASLPTHAVILTDSTFEHDTQAASGQTTGRWAVLFTDSSMLRKHDRALQVVQELAADEDKEVIYAVVDFAQNHRLGKRFGDDVFLPCIALFRDRLMYVFDKPFDSHDIAEQIKDFVSSGYEATTAHTVPGVPDHSATMERIQSTGKVDWKTVGFALALIFAGICFQTWAIVNKNKFRPEPTTVQSRVRAAPQGAAAVPAKKTR